MACVNTANFIVIINGLPTIFFKESRGLRQECSMSLILFLLSMEELSRRITEYCDRGVVKGISMTRQIHISHLIFVNDLLFGGEASTLEWSHFHQLLSTFGSLLGLILNKNKSKMISPHLDEEVTMQICDIFGITYQPLGLHYLEI